MANVIKHKRGSGSDPSASNLVIGELAIRTDNGKLFTKMDSGAIAEIAGGGSDIAINTLSASSGTGGNASGVFDSSAYRFTLSSPPSVSAQQLLVSINGVIQKPVAGTGQPSEGFSVDGTDIILGDAPATGSDFFILTFRSLGVSEPADNSVTSAKIADGAIVNADINASAAIAGSKISPDFTGQVIKAQQLEISYHTPQIKLIDVNNDSDFDVMNQNGVFKVFDRTNSAGRLHIASDGTTDIFQNLNVGAGLDVTGITNCTNGVRVNTDGSASADYISVGASQDLKIYHDGNHSYIRDIGTGGLRITTDSFNVVSSPNNEAMITATENGAVNLYHDHNLRLATNSSGVSVTGNLTVDNGTSSTIRLEADSGGEALFLATGGANAQATAAIELMQSSTSLQGGGISYNGDGSPAWASGEAADRMTFYRRINGVRHEVFSYSYAQNDVEFNGNILTNTDGSSDIGTNSTRFSRVYADALYGQLQNTLFTSAVHIDVNGTDDGSTTLLTLDNYIADIGTEYTWIDFTFRDSNSNATPQLKIGAQAGDPTGSQVQEGTADFVVQCGVDNSATANTMTEMFRVSHENKITSVNHHPQSDSNFDLGTNTVRWRNVYADTLYGDGSNLTGISSVGGSTGVDFNDNVKARFGTGNDLEIYHDSNHSYIIDNGTGDLKLRGSEAVKIEDTSSGKPMITCTKNFGTEIYHQMNSAVATAEVKFATTSTGVTITGNALPASNNAHDLGSTSNRWRNVYTNDLNLSNEGGSNDVDGTWGSYTIQEGAEDLFLVNKRNGKKYKFNLTEVS